MDLLSLIEFNYYALIALPHLMLPTAGARSLVARFGIQDGEVPAGRKAEKRVPTRKRPTTVGLFGAVGRAFSLPDSSDGERA